LEIRITPHARQDLREISQWLIEHFPEKSLQTYEQITTACTQLTEFPEIGRRGSITDTREMKISRLPYRIIYRIRGKQLFILRIYHTARKPLNK
jgi:toxin ParE1/3/4